MVLHVWHSVPKGSTMRLSSQKEVVVMPCFHTCCLFMVLSSVTRCRLRFGIVACLIPRGREGGLGLEALLAQWPAKFELVWALEIVQCSLLHHVTHGCICSSPPLRTSPLLCYLETLVAAA